MQRRGRSAGLLLAVMALVMLVGCGRLPGSPPETTAAEPRSFAPATPGPGAPSASPASPSPSELTAPTLDLEALRAALLGPSPVPVEWEAQVDGILATIDDAIREHAVPSVAGMDAVEASCATWEPMVGRLGWANGAVAERHVMLSHLVQLAVVAPDDVAPSAEAAARVVAAAAAAQLSTDGDAADVSRAPRVELRAIGRWALERCELPVTADASPDTEGWTDDDIALSCDLDRRMLTEAMDEFRAEPGAGRYATHPHELEIAELEVFVFPAWHMVATVDNEADPPTYDVIPIPGAFCDR